MHATRPSASISAGLIWSSPSGMTGSGNFSSDRNRFAMRRPRVAPSRSSIAMRGVLLHARAPRCDVPVTTAPAEATQTEHDKRQRRQTLAPRRAHAAAAGALARRRARRAGDLGVGRGWARVVAGRDVATTGAELGVR